MIAEANRIASAPGKIYEAIIEAKSRVGAIGKNGQVTQYGKYDFRKFDDVIDVVAPLLNEFGIMIIPTVMHREDHREGKNHFVTLTMNYRLFAKDGSCVEGSAVGEAFDVGDKAATKAQTVALRIFYCTTLNIPYNEMKDPEDGPQSTWTEKKQDTFNRLMGTLSCLQDSKLLNGLLGTAIKLLNTTNEKGDHLTAEELFKAKEAFVSAARRLRFGENAVATIEKRIDDALGGKKPESDDAAQMTVEPVGIRELLYDFGLAKDNTARERLILTTLQSYRTQHIESGDIGEIVAKYCPENETNGHACFFLGAIHSSDTAAEIAQMSESLRQAIQQKSVGVDVGNALSQYAQHRIDGLGGSDGDA